MKSPRNCRQTATAASCAVARWNRDAPGALAAEAADADAGMGEIIVTASRRAENARDVPVAVSVLASEKLDVLNSSGLGNTDFDINAAQPVSVVHDDVALENPVLKSFPIFDVANVQVLRGPQGTLFGGNTPAGVVKISSAAPGDERNGHGSVSWSTCNTVNAEAAIGEPLGGGFNARVSGPLQRRDDWVTNTAATGLADKAVGYGLEAEFAPQPVAGLDLSASGSWNFTEIRDPGLRVGACGSGQCTVHNPRNAAGPAFIDGNDLPQAPRFIGVELRGRF